MAQHLVNALGQVRFVPGVELLKVGPAWVGKQSPWQASSQLNPTVFQSLDMLLDINTAQSIKWANVKNIRHDMVLADI